MVTCGLTTRTSHIDCRMNPATRRCARKKVRRFGRISQSWHSQGRKGGREIYQNLDLLASISQLAHEACAPLPAAVLQKTWGFAIEHRCPHLRRRNSLALPSPPTRAMVLGFEAASTHPLHPTASTSTSTSTIAPSSSPSSLSPTAVADHGLTHQQGFGTITEKDSPRNMTPDDGDFERRPPLLQVCHVLSWVVKLCAPTIAKP